MKARSRSLLALGAAVVSTLGVACGVLAGIDPHDFVVVQEQCLKAWASLVQQVGETPGSWVRPIR